MCERSFGPRRGGDETDDKGIGVESDDEGAGDEESDVETG